MVPWTSDPTVSDVSAFLESAGTKPGSTGSLEMENNIWELQQLMHDKNVHLSTAKAS